MFRIGEGVCQGDAAVMLNVGKRSVERARAVLDKGSPNHAGPGELICAAASICPC